MTSAPQHRRAWAEVDLAAIRGNTAALADLVAPAVLCAVVKANAYGHGAVPSARAALEGGATWLAVALVEEGTELRDAGVDAPILLLSEPPADAFPAAVDARLALTLYTAEGVRRAAAVASGAPVSVHVKVDTGMHRVGVAPADAVSLALAVHESDDLRLDGVWTHFAVADELDKNAVTEAQLRTLDDVLAALDAKGVDPGLVHAANTAGVLVHPRSRRSLVRAGIGIYGYAPLRGSPVELKPAMSLKAEVTFVKTVDGGERVSYGARYEMKESSRVATVSLGYADGVPRRLAAMGGQVLIGGRRRPIAGTVTMDQLMVDCGPDDPVRAGDEVVLLGAQGDEMITADDWAERLDTISYEIVCGIGPRVPRIYV